MKNTNSFLQTRGHSRKWVKQLLLRGPNGVAYRLAISATTCASGGLLNDMAVNNTAECAPLFQPLLMYTEAMVTEIRAAGVPHEVVLCIMTFSLFVHSKSKIVCLAKFVYYHILFGCTFDGY